MNAANYVLAQLFKRSLFDHELERWNAERLRSFLDEQVALLRKDGLRLPDADVENVVEEVVKWDSSLWSQA